MAKKSSNALDTTMTTDVFVRHLLAKNLVKNVLKKGNKPLHILDLGGYKGRTAEFFPDDKVTVLDVYEDKGANYIKGDATKMTFDDNSYDLVTSFDVYEHIPRKHREAFITEGMRVAKEGVIMTMPIDDQKSGRTHTAEVRLNKFFRQVSGQDHPWLKEHIEYGIPTVVEVEKLLQKKKYFYKMFFSDNRLSWQLLQMVNFSAVLNDSAAVAARRVNNAYNLIADQIEPVTRDGYRAVVVVVKTKQQYARLEKFFAQHAKDNQEKGIDIALEAMSELFATVLTVADSEKKKRHKLETEISTKQHENNLLQLEIGNLKNSKSWKLTKPLRVLKKRGR